MIGTKNFLLIGLALVFLSACTVTAKTDKAKVKVPGGVEVEIEDGDHDNKEGGHCPPGHRKKGWC